MPFLNDLQDWIVRNTMQELPTGHPPNDDVALALLLWTASILIGAVMLGQCIVHHAK